MRGEKEDFIDSGELDHYLPLDWSRGRFFITIPKSIIQKIGLDKELAMIPKRVIVYIDASDSDYLYYRPNDLESIEITGKWSGKFNCSVDAKMILKKYLGSSKTQPKFTLAPMLGLQKGGTLSSPDANSKIGYNDTF